MATIKVFAASDALAALRTNPDKVLTIIKKKDDKTFKAGCWFMDNRFTIGAHPPSEGWFSIKDVVLTRTVPDPSDASDRRNENNEDGKDPVLQLETNLSNAGDFGQFLFELDPIWKAKIQKMTDDGVLNIGKRNVVGLVQTHLSLDNKTNPGGEIEDPIVRFKVDFSTFSDRHPTKVLRSKQKSQFLDFDTAYVDAAGVTQYHPAKVVDPITGELVPVNPYNLHLFATEGSIIKEGRIMMTGVPVAKISVSMPMFAQRIVLKRADEVGFSDEPAPVAPLAAANNALSALGGVAPTTPPVATPPAAPATTPATNEHAIDVDNIQGELNDLIADI